jgi:hypothetical protein
LRPGWRRSTSRRGVAPSGNAVKDFSSGKLEFRGV